MPNVPVRPVGICQRHLRVMRPVTWFVIPQSWWYTTQTGVEYRAMWLCDDCLRTATEALAREGIPPLPVLKPLEIDGFPYPSERVQDIARHVAMLRDVASASHDVVGETVLSHVVRLLAFTIQTLTDQGR